MGGSTGDAEALDGEVIDTDQLHVTLDQPVRAVRVEVDEVRPKCPRRVPPARVTRAQQDTPAGARDASLRQIDSADTTLHATKVRAPRRSHEALRVDPVDPFSALDEVAGRIDVCPGVRSEAELADL